jgi:hypothetical protein
VGAAGDDAAVGGAGAGGDAPVAADTGGDGRDGAAAPDGAAGTGGTDGAAGPEAGGAGAKRIFHLQNGIVGKIRGTSVARPAEEQADERCTEHARARGWGGAWRAWLSTSRSAAIDRIADVGPWFRLDRVTKLFEDREQFRAGPLAPINPGAGADPRNLFWTGTRADGTTSANTCSDWESYQPAQLLGDVGRADVAGRAWNEHEPIACGTYLALLCVEQ